MGCAGSIPACAGQPRASRPYFPSPCDALVYPRVCGAAAHTGYTVGQNVDRGLSPRVRGSLLPGQGQGRGCERSIPACAGQPHTIASRRLVRPCGVYPRVCGAAVLPWLLMAQLAAGSIPACAGQPPRASVIQALAGKVGLSPRVRGSHTSASRMPKALVTVYPRVCGAASSTQEIELHVRSPRVYPRVCGAATVTGHCQTTCIHRSIPACAGQPWPTGLTRER